MSPTAYTQGYQPIASNDFGGGLNLRDKADTVNAKEAIDLLNVTFTDRGAVRTRDGLVDVTGSDLSARVNSMSPFSTVAGLRQLVAALDNGDLVAINAAGTPVSSISGLSGAPCTFARFGSPTIEYLYIANGIDTMRRWDGASWADGSVIATVNGTAGVAMPRAGAVCVTAQAPGQTSASNANNRLVATAFGTNPTAGPGGAATTPSRVYWSNKGDPHTWETDGATVGPSTRGRNFMDFTPGDGEQIMAAVTWRELVFVFKETKFFVMWGEGTASDGTPIFNFREVVNSTGLAGRLAVCVGRDGVYFFNRRGVYHTNGGDPTLLSDKMRPLWTGDLDVYYQGSAINMAQIGLVRLAWLNEQLHVTVPTGTSAFNDRLLVYDTQHQWWTVHDIAASALAPFRRVDIDELHHGFATGVNRVGHTNPGSRLDRTATAITSRWRSGWSDYGLPVQKDFREMKVWGAGAATVSFSTDFHGAQTDSRNALFGVTTTWPTGGTWADWIAANGGVWPGGGQIADVMIRLAVRGTALSTQFSNSPTFGTWAIHRVVRNLRETRGASVR